MSDNKWLEKRIAREIISLMEEIYFGEEFLEYRCKYGSNGTRDLILQTIKYKYNIA